MRRGIRRRDFLRYFLLRLIRLLRLLLDISGHILLRRRSGCYKGRLSWRSFGRRRRGGQSALYLFRLQVTQTLVDGLAHVVLHFLQIGEGYLYLGVLTALISTLAAQDSSRRRNRFRSPPAEKSLQLLDFVVRLVEILPSTVGIRPLQRLLGLR